MPPALAWLRAEFWQRGWRPRRRGASSPSSSASSPPACGRAPVGCSIGAAECVLAFMAFVVVLSALAGALRLRPGASGSSSSGASLRRRGSLRWAR
eukprot:1319651-Heterocapsa_arctica.AAC.1